MKRAGIVDVASLAGVSRQTVTRAMNDMPGINAKTKRRVLEAARELRYRPSRFGRGLVNRGRPSLGESPRGRIAVSWSLRGDAFILDIEVPPGADSALHLPAGVTLPTGETSMALPSRFHHLAGVATIRRWMRPACPWMMER